MKQAVANTEAGPVHVTSASASASPGMELDLRGQNCRGCAGHRSTIISTGPIWSGMPFVRIIHGKGTGKLRELVRGMLKDHPHVASFEEGHQSEGGAGVTVLTAPTNYSALTLARRRSRLPMAWRSARHLENPGKPDAAVVRPRSDACRGRL